MNWFKKFLLKLKTPRPLYAVLYSIFSVLFITATVVLLCLGYQETILAYCSYAVSAILLTYLVYIVIYFAPKIKNGIINLLKKHKFTNELLESYGYRSLVFATFSFLINIAYAVFQAVIAIMSRSIWYGALATYYIALSLIRGGVVAISRKSQKNAIDPKRQVLSYRNCGIYLIILNFALTGAIVQMVFSDQGFRYPGLMIYVIATYTFYKLTMSIYNIFKARKQTDYTIQSIRNISFADSLVSLLALQTALLQEFSVNYQPILPNSLTGGAISLIIIAIGIIMVVRGTKELKYLKQENITNNG